ncbi:hypothetical protein GDO81_015596 [Engystomops pustulosus]|uniref:Uncharacterized protein n=1 Tax=Engystomops pustulosus TaxID=76066 RepID=A0AAV7ALD8_ENGPU|nr:hypothetical protein GDO81_015596 [Engystomops pustulosus]
MQSRSSYYGYPISWPKMGIQISTILGVACVFRAFHSSSWLHHSIDYLPLFSCYSLSVTPASRSSVFAMWTCTLLVYTKEIFKGLSCYLFCFAQLCKSNLDPMQLNPSCPSAD